FLLRLPGGRVAFEVAEDVQLLLDVLVATRLQLGDGLLVGPALELHAVNGTVGAGAVSAGEAVDEHGMVDLVGEHGADGADAVLDGSSAGGVLPVARRDADEVDAVLVAPGLLGLVGRGGAVAQVDDGADAVVVDDAAKALDGHLAAAVEDAFADDAEV